MGIKGGTAALAVALIAVLLMAVPADAKLIRYAGQSSQGMKVVLKTNAKGRAKRLAIHFDAKCRKGKVSNGIQYFYAPFDKASYRDFSSHIGFKQRFPKYGTSGKFRVRVFGRRVDRDRISGTFDWRAKYFVKGKQYSACRIHTVHWSVHR